MRRAKFIMKATTFFAAVALCSSAIVAREKVKTEKEPSDDKNRASMFSLPSSLSPAIRRISDSVYDVIGLAAFGLEREVFFNAYKGLEFLKSKHRLRKTRLLTICDYSQSINNKRLYVIDVVSSRLLFQTYVSHGKNSGDEYANSFSNQENSNKSSLGFMVTGTTYTGIAGYSLKLEGVERGINHNVAMRSIVMHGSKFVNEHTMLERGSMGKSYGCPAIPMALHKKIIDAIKGGSCLYVYHSDEQYARKSAILNASFDVGPAIPLPDLSKPQGWEMVGDVLAVVR